MVKSLIIGLDLSFSSTGICISYLEDNIGKKIQFHKVMFDDCSNKTGKAYTPEQIKNVNIITYRMPTNLLAEGLVFDINDENNFEQSEITLKAIVASKKILNIIENSIKRYNPNEIMFSIENYIMPNFSGKNQLKHVSGLITLQGFVRRDCILLCLKNNIQIKLYTPTPSSNKLFFTGNGNAEKPEMLKYFLTYYNGNKLLPTIKESDSAKINDVIDAFSLVMNAYSKHI